MAQNHKAQPAQGGDPVSVEPPDNSVHPLTRAEWREWLAANHTRTEGV